MSFPWKTARRAWDGAGKLDRAFTRYDHVRDARALAGQVAAVAGIIDEGGEHMSWPKVIQLVEVAKDEREAEEMLEALALQEGCLGGRVIGGSGTVGVTVVGKPFAAQAFFEDTEISDEALTAIGMRRVLLTPELQELLGVRG